MNDSQAVRITKGGLALMLLVPVALGVALGVSISSPVLIVVSLAFAIFPVAVLHEAVRNRTLYGIRDACDEESLSEEAVKRDRDFWNLYDPSNPVSPAGIHRRAQDDLAQKMNETLHRQHGMG
ncbi:MAG: hypothetical protein NTW01_03495 [Gammaproteobacteria bacterium]|nr:hypothetical protein [Gammaproteobacteria bacterium]